LEFKFLASIVNHVFYPDVFASPPLDTISFQIASCGPRLLRRIGIKQIFRIKPTFAGKNWTAMFYCKVC